MDMHSLQAYDILKLTLAFRKLSLAFRKLSLAFRKLTLAFRKLTHAFRKLSLAFRKLTLAFRKLTLAFRKQILHEKYSLLYFNSNCWKYLSVLHTESMCYSTYVEYSWYMLHTESNVLQNECTVAACCTVNILYCYMLKVDLCTLKLYCYILKVDECCTLKAMAAYWKWMNVAH